MNLIRQVRGKFILFTLVYTLWFVNVKTLNWIELDWIELWSLWSPLLSSLSSWSYQVPVCRSSCLLIMIDYTNKTSIAFNILTGKLSYYTLAFLVFEKCQYIYCWMKNAFPYTFKIWIISILFSCRPIVKILICHFTIILSFLMIESIPIIQLYTRSFSEIYRNFPLLPRPLILIHSIDFTLPKFKKIQ